MPSNTAIQIEPNQKGNDTFTVSNLDKLEEPDSLKALKKLVARLLPRIDLPEALLEIHAKTGFMDEFIHGSLESSRVADLPISICAVLVAQSCNIGLKALARNDVPALTRNRLAWIQQNYLRSETLLRANARLVDAQTQIPLAQAWGGGDVVFGLFWLLGYQFSPRLADVGEARFWRLDQSANYGALDGIARRYREGQEDQLSALGLVVNALILWNTYYMDEALTSLRQGQSVNQEDVARLSPLGHAHINMLGRYQFSLLPAVIAGKMRPLRDLNDTDEQDD